MKIKNTYKIDPTILALDFALQLQKARRILDSYKYDKEMTAFGKGCQSTTRQMIKWQVWTNPAFKPLMVREYRRLRVVSQKTERGPVTQATEKKMNAITKSAKGITSITLSEFIAAGGELTRLEIITGARPDDTIHVFECAGRDGTFRSDNASVSWFNAKFERVLAALRAGDVSDLPDSHGIATI